MEGDLKDDHGFYLFLKDCFFVICYYIRRVKIAAMISADYLKKYWMLRKRYKHLLKPEKLCKTLIFSLDADTNTSILRAKCAAENI